MTTNNSDFVLDDDLDEDEDILQLQASQQRAFDDEPLLSPPRSPPHSSYTQIPAQPESPKAEEDNKSNPSAVTSEDTDRTTAVIIDGLPITARRNDLDAFLSTCASSIINVRLRRLEHHGLLRVRVEFESAEGAEAACACDGADWNGSSVSVKRASEERWNASMTGESASQATAARRRDVQPKSPGIPLPDASAVSRSFWSAFGAARTLAGRLEEGARKLGDNLEHQLHVSENVEKGRARVRDVDAEYNVSGRVAELAQVGRETATAVDKKLHISEGVGTVVEGVGGAARIVAREVDENLHVSEKAREAANAAMTNPTVGAVARSVVGTLDGTTPPRKKNYRPSREGTSPDGDVTPADAEPTVPDDSMPRELNPE